MTGAATVTADSKEEGTHRRSVPEAAPTTFRELKCGDDADVRQSTGPTSDARRIGPPERGATNVAQLADADIRRELDHNRSGLRGSLRPTRPARGRSMSPVVGFSEPPPAESRGHMRRPLGQEQRLPFTPRSDWRAQCSRTKLVEDEVREIRARSDAGESYAALARAFNVIAVNVQLICDRKRWAWLN